MTNLLATMEEVAYNDCWFLFYLFEFEMTGGNVVSSSRPLAHRNKQDSKRRNSVLYLVHIFAVDKCICEMELLMPTLSYFLHKPWYY